MALNVNLKQTDTGASKKKITDDEQWREIVRREGSIEAAHAAGYQYVDTKPTTSLSDLGKFKNGTNAAAELNIKPTTNTAVGTSFSQSEYARVNSQVINNRIAELDKQLATANRQMSTLQNAGRNATLYNVGESFIKSNNAAQAEQQKKIQALQTERDNLYRIQTKNSMQITAQLQAERDQAQQKNKQSNIKYGNLEAGLGPVSNEAIERAAEQLKDFDAYVMPPKEFADAMNGRVGADIRSTTAAIKTARQNAEIQELEEQAYRISQLAEIEQDPERKKQLNDRYVELLQQAKEKGAGDLGRLIGIDVKRGGSSMATGFAGFGAALESLAAAPVNLVGRLLGEEQLIDPSNGAFSQLYEGNKDVLNRFQQEHESEVQKFGDNKVWSIVGDVVTGTVAAVPQAALALATGGASLGAQFVGDTLSVPATNMLETVSGTMFNLIKDPGYWTSFVQEGGSAYQEARELGASESQAVAAAVYIATINAAIEIGLDTQSGIQGIDFNEKMTAGKLLKEVGMQEAGEEAVQGLYNKALQKIVYMPQMKTFGSGGVFDPMQTFEEAFMGGAVGMILGGGNVLANTVLEGAGTQKINNLGKNIRSNPETMSNLAQYGMALEPGTSDFETAEKLRNNVQVSNDELGSLYANYMQAYTSQRDGLIKNAVRDRLGELGETDIEKQAGEIMKQIRTGKDAELSDTGAQVYAELTDLRNNRQMKFTAYTTPEWVQSLQAQMGELQNRFTSDDNLRLRQERAQQMHQEVMERQGFVPKTVMERSIEQAKNPQLPQRSNINALPTAEETDRNRRWVKAQTDTARSGILAGANDKTIRQAERLSKWFGTDVRFFRASVARDGFHQGGTIFINVNGKNPLASIVTHELTHRLENTRAYQAFQDTALRLLSNGDTDALNKLIKDKIDTYAKYGETLDEDGARRELTAEYVQKKMLTDMSTIKRFVRANRPGAINFRGNIGNMLSRMTGAEVQEKSLLQQAYDLYGQALREANEARESGRQWSIKPDLADDLDKVLKNTFPASKTEVVIGTTSDFLVNEIGADALSVTMPARKAYANMVSEERARDEGRYDDDLDYHNLGRDKLIEILTASETPVAAFADYPDAKGNERKNRIVLVTNKKINNNYAVVIAELDTYGRILNKQVKVNKDITAFDKKTAGRDIIEAATEHRLLYLDKKRSQGVFAGKSGTTFLTTMQGIDFTDNIQQFWANVKGANNNTTSSGTVSEMQGWQEKLAGIDVNDYQNDSGDSSQPAEENVSNLKAVRTSMSMDQARDMIQRAFVLSGIKEWYEGEYRNGDEWLKAQGTDEVAMYIENEYTLQEKYLNKIPGYIDGDVSLEEILEAYLNNELTGTVRKATAQRLDTKQETGYRDSKFYAPKDFDIAGAKSTYDIATQKVTNANRQEVNAARAKVLFLAHNVGAAEAMGISQAELNKKLRTWSSYSKNAVDVSNRINQGVPIENRWTGIQNCSIINKMNVSDEDILSMVKNIEGKSDSFKRQYIGRTMLALDTHIDWSNLTFEFMPGQFSDKKSVRGRYQKNRIAIANSGYANTVAHEMGHALDAIWGREVFGEERARSGDVFLSDTALRPDLITDAETRQFYDNYRAFIDSITDVSDLYSEYTQDSKEVFARFIAKFVEFTDVTAGNNFYQESSMYNDRFSAKHYLEFARLLQEKAMLDSKKATQSVNSVEGAQWSITPEEANEKYGIVYGEDDIQNTGLIRNWEHRDALVKAVEEKLSNNPRFDDVDVYESRGMGSWETFYVTVTTHDTDGEEFSAEARFSNHDSKYGGADVYLWNNNYKTVDECLDDFERKLEDHLSFVWDRQSDNGRQYSITPEERQSRLAELRQYLAGEKTARELSWQQDKARQIPNLMTYGDTLATKIIDTAHGQGLSVDEYLRQNTERYERDGRYNEEARRALEMERRQYSITDDPDMDEKMRLLSEIDALGEDISADEYRDIIERAENVGYRPRTEPQTPNERRTQLNNLSGWLNFINNIEEDAEHIQVRENPEERERLLQQVVGQILEKKAQNAPTETQDEFLDAVTDGKIQIDPDDTKRQMQRDIDEVWDQWVDFANPIGPRTNPEDLVSTGTNKQRQTSRRQRRKVQIVERARELGIDVIPEIEKATPNKITKPVAESKPTESKRALKNDIWSIFQIPSGFRKQFSAIIDDYADRIINQGYIGYEDLRNFTQFLYGGGIVKAARIPALQDIANEIIGGQGVHMYVDPIVKTELGDDWNSVRKRAFANKIYLTNDKNEMSIDMVWKELSDSMPGVFAADEYGQTEQLMTMLDIAENGRMRNIPLKEYTRSLAEEGVTESAVLEELENKASDALRRFAEKAELEIRLKDRTGIMIAREQEKRRAALLNLRREEIQRRAKEQTERAEARRRQSENRYLREMQQKTLKQIQWLAKNRNKAPEELKATWDEVLGDIDIYAVSAANEMNWSDKYQKTWRDLADMYNHAKEYDPNFLPSKEMEKIVMRLNADHIADMDIDALRDLYKAAIGIRTEFYNRNNLLNDDQHRLFADVYANVKEEFKNAASGYKTGKVAGAVDTYFNDMQLTPMNYLERMAGWNPDSDWYSMAKQLEAGERAARRFDTESHAMLDDWINEHKDWIKRADGQGKDAIWYEITVPELLELGMGDKPIFGNTVTVYMTPMQKVHMYLESKNYDNLRHMVGGRTFADKELYSQGKRSEAFAQGTTIRLAPETVKGLVSNLTAEEKALADILEKYYNEYSSAKINEVSNVLYGYDKSIGKNYAPIFTNKNYTKSDPGIFDITAEGVGNMKGRVTSSNPSYNLSALDAFDRSVRQTAKFVGLAIPIRNMNTLMNWRESNNSMGDIITHKHGEAAKNFVNDLMTELQSGKEIKHEKIEEFVNKALARYISATFGFNPSIVLKQFASYPLAAAYLGWSNMPVNVIESGHGADIDFISKYTGELDYRLKGYATPETAALTDNPSRLEENKAFKFVFGGGSITWMDSFTVRTLWAWAENKVSKEQNLEKGTKEQISAGESPFYKQVAKEFEEAVSRSQPMYDVMHRSNIMRSSGPITKAFTLFKTVPQQEYNMLRQTLGEAQYYAKSKTATAEQKRAARQKAGRAITGIMVGNLMIGTITFLNALVKNGAKAYRDDDKKLTLESFMEQFGKQYFRDSVGISAGADQVADIVNAMLFKDRWYGIETPGITQIESIIEEMFDAGGNAWDLVTDSIYVLRNGGDWQQYMKDNSGKYLASVEKMVRLLATYGGGFAAENLRGYLLGALSWLAPEAKTAYEDMLDTPVKGDLKGMSGDALEKRIGHIMEYRANGIQSDTSAAIAELYEMGYTGAMPPDVSKSYKIEGEDRPLDIVQQQTYQNAWSDTVNGVIDTLTASDDFKNADAETRTKMLKKLYDYAAEKAKAAVFDDYEIDSTAEKYDALLSEGVSLAEISAAGAVLTGTVAEDSTALKNMSFSDKSKIALYNAFVSDAHADVIDELKETGLAFDDFLNISVKITDIKNDKLQAGYVKTNAIRDLIRESGFTGEQKKALYREYVSASESNQANIKALEDAGVNFDNFLNIQNEVARIDDEYSGAGQKATELSRWLNTTSYTTEQKDVIKDTFKYYSQIPAEAKRYDDLIAAGISDDKAYAVTNALNALKPLPGANEVSNIQKWETVTSANLTAQEQITVLQGLMGDSDARKVKIAYDYGIEPQYYVQLKKIMPDFDADKNGSYTNAEVTNAINSMTFSSAGSGILGGLVLPTAGTNSMRAALWQLQTGSTSAKNNPYSNTIGAEVLAAVKTAKENEKSQVTNAAVSSGNSTGIHIDFGGGNNNISSGITLPTAAPANNSSGGIHIDFGGGNNSQNTSSTPITGSLDAARALLGG